MRHLAVALSMLALSVTSSFSQDAAAPPAGMISPSRPVAKGMAPGMTFKLVHTSPGERTFAIIFTRGDEAISGLTDFARQNHISDAHFTAIGASNSALLAWFDIPQKSYRPIPVNEQCEVLSMTGDIAAYLGTPIVHAHTVLGRSDGATHGGHTFELHVNPTLEVFLTASDIPLAKVQDPGGLKLIDPAQ
jgi:predicted DNA-binding protein with PD1-like motif